LGNTAQAHENMMLQPCYLGLLWLWGCNAGSKVPVIIPQQKTDLQQHKSTSTDYWRCSKARGDNNNDDDDDDDDDDSHDDE